MLDTSCVDIQSHLINLQEFIQSSDRSIALLLSKHVSIYDFLVIGLTIVCGQNRDI